MQRHRKQTVRVISLPDNKTPPQERDVCRFTHFISIFIKLTLYIDGVITAIRHESEQVRGAIEIGRKRRLESRQSRELPRECRYVYGEINVRARNRYCDINPRSNKHSRDRMLCDYYGGKKNHCFVFI